MESILHRDEEHFLASVREATHLLAQIDTLPESAIERLRLIMCWATIADQISSAIFRAEEFLDEYTLTQLKTQVNGVVPPDPMRWIWYRTTPYRFKALTGFYLSEIASTEGKQDPF